MLKQADKLQRETLARQTYLRLRNDILRGAFEPGQKLKIDEVAQSYGTGSSPVREALNLLTSDGIVERLEQRGFRVRDASAAEFDDLLKMRCWLEERALRESIERGRSEWEEAIVLSFYRLQRMERYAADGSNLPDPQWEAQHKQFHMSLIGACTSPILYRYCNQLYDQNIRYRYITRLASDVDRNTDDEHELIMEAALGRDTDQATRRLVDHYTLTGEYLRQALFPASNAADISVDLSTSP